MHELNSTALKLRIEDVFVRRFSFTQPRIFRGCVNIAGNVWISPGLCEVPTRWSWLYTILHFICDFRWPPRQTRHGCIQKVDSNCVHLDLKSVFSTGHFNVLHLLLACLASFGGSDWNRKPAISYWIYTRQFFLISLVYWSICMFVFAC